MKLLQTNSRQVRTLLRDLIFAGSCDPVIRAWAANCVREIPAHSSYDECAVLFSAVRDHVRYTGDIARAETFQSARQTLRIAIGDCDDMCILLGACLESVGHQVDVFFCDTNFDGAEDHVILGVHVNNLVIPADPAFSAVFGELPGPMRICYVA